MLHAQQFIKSTAQLFQIIPLNRVIPASSLNGHVVCGVVVVDDGELSLCFAHGSLLSVYQLYKMIIIMLFGYTKLYILIKIIYLQIRVLRDIIYSDGEGNPKTVSLMSDFIF